VPSSVTATDIILAVGSIITLLIALSTAASAARRGAFEDLEKVVKRLEAQLNEETQKRKELESELRTERRQRIRFENYIHVLIRQLRDAHIEPAEMDQEDTLPLSDEY